MLKMVVNVFENYSMKLLQLLPAAKESMNNTGIIFLYDMKEVRQRWLCVIMVNKI